MTKVIQLIDSLDAGGAERLAVTYANILTNKIEGSYLCATRKEGLLKSTIKDEVGFLFLNKKSSLDYSALKQFNKYLKKNNIKVVHAHATSFFFATLAKCLNPKLKIIWHDHYGNSEQLNKRPKWILKFCSLFFNQIFSVNQRLFDWAKNHLWCNNVDYLRNIVGLDGVDASTQLKGTEGKRVLCLANLRPQKDHINLFKAFQRVLVKHSEWTLHCVGKDFEDNYSQTVKQFLVRNKLHNSIYFYGSKSDVKNIMSQCEIGVLSSKSEGLPLALLEYGFGELATVVTNVGDCNRVIDSNELGLIVESENDVALSKALVYYIDNPLQRQKTSSNLRKKVTDDYSKDSVVQKLIKVYSTKQK